MIFKQEVKKIIKDAENSLNIFEPKIIINGEEFQKDKQDVFIKAIKNFDTNVLKNINKYDKILKSEIIKVLQSINEVNNLIVRLE